MTLNFFVHSVGIPRSLHSDNHKNFSAGDFAKRTRYFCIPQTFTEPHSPRQNCAEFAGGEVKSYGRKIMMETYTPIRLWCYAFEYAADILCLCASKYYDLQGRTPYELVAGYTPDISEYVTFSWYQWCYYWDESMKQKELCRWLGPGKKTGQAICYNIITFNGICKLCSSVIPVPPEDFEIAEVKRQQDRFTKSVEKHIGNSKQALYNEEHPYGIYYTVFGDPYEPEEVAPLFYADVKNTPDEIPLTPFDEPYIEALDKYIGTKVVIPAKEGEQPILARYSKRAQT